MAARPRDSTANVIQRQMVRVSVVRVLAALCTRRALPPPPPAVARPPLHLRLQHRDVGERVRAVDHVTGPDSAVQAGVGAAVRRPESSERASFPPSPTKVVGNKDWKGSVTGR